MGKKITEREFKKLFNLSEKCKISKQALNSLTKQITGAYLLYEEVQKIKQVKFKNSDNTLLQAMWVPFSHGFQNFVHSLGSKGKFDVSYMNKGDTSSTPFWTYTKYKKEEIVHIKNSAYTIFIEKILRKLLFKYSKYKISFIYSDYASNQMRTHPNDSIWWEEVTFTPIFYVDKNQIYKTIEGYQIQRCITNRDGIWTGDILPPIQKIINEIKQYGI